MNPSGGLPPDGFVAGCCHPPRVLGSLPELSADPNVRREQLVEFWRELSDCRKCALAGGRTTVVFGTGNANADLMFVGEAPGFHEDQQGKPFVGRAGKLLDQLLDEIGLTRKECFIANVLKCRPPGNRDPHPVEIDACKGHLWRQIELIEPRVVCSLGNFATKLLSGSPAGITRVRGVAQARELGGRPVFLYPIFHPAAALRTPAMLDRLQADFASIPELLAQDPPGFGAEPAAGSEPPRAAEPELVGASARAELDQLGLF
jgi:uracil-DNA glycosylase family 4